MGCEAIRRTLSGVLLACICWGGAQEQQPAVAGEPESQVRRIDPRTREFHPVSPDQIVPGKIYSHYSPRHGRFVWAVAQADGTFGYALGPGTTESPRNFDLAATAAQAQQALLELAGEDWLKALQRQGGSSMVRLGADNRWSLLKVKTIRSHFDLDTGRRYEWHGARRVSILHGNGNAWAFVDDWYVPANARFRSTPLGDCWCAPRLAD